MPHGVGAGLDYRRPLAENLALLVERRATGTLTVRSPVACREFVLVDGAIHTAHSDADEEKLGTWLVRNGLIDDYDVALALLSQEAEGLALGRRLVGRGLIDVATLRGELAHLSLLIVRNAASDRVTRCELHPNAAGEALPTLAHLPARQVIMEAARAGRNTAAQEEALGLGSNVVCRAEGADAVLEQVILTKTEAYALEQLDQEPTVEEVLSSKRYPRAELVSAMYSLYTAGLIEVVAAQLPTVPEVPAASVPVGTAPEATDRRELLRWEVEERERITRLSEESRTWGHYEVLGLPRNAPAEAIAESWRAYQHLYSVHRAGEDHLRGWEDRLARILRRARRAFETLSDPTTRHHYDELLGEAVEEAFEAAGGEDLLAGLVGDLAPREDQWAPTPGGEAGTGEASEPAPTDREREAADRYIARAERLLGRGETEEAVDLLEQACALDPRPPELVKLARLLLAEPRWSNRALTTLRTALEKDRGDVEAWLELARFWQGRKDRDRQRRALEGALAAEPRNTDARAMYRKLMGHAELIRLLRELLGEPGD